MILKNFTLSDVINALENNIQNRFSYFQKQIKTMNVIKQDSLLMINGREMTDMFNIICCQGKVEKYQVAKAIEYFKKQNLPFAWWVGFENESQNLSHLLEESGLTKTEEELAMGIELNSAIIPEIPNQLTIKRVVDIQGIHDFIRVITDIIPHEKTAIQSFYQQTTDIILSPNAEIELYVGYIEDQPISTCSVFFSDGVAGIFDIIASPNIRGMGIGSAMTIAAMQAAIDRKYAVAVLTATDNAKFLYEKLGFNSLKSMGVYTISQ